MIAFFIILLVYPPQRYTTVFKPKKIRMKTIVPDNYSNYLCQQPLSIKQWKQKTKPGK